jgi:hypothetical protein
MACPAIGQRIRLKREDTRVFLIVGEVDERSPLVLAAWISSCLTCPACRGSIVSWSLIRLQGCDHERDGMVRGQSVALPHTGVLLMEVPPARSVGLLRSMA